MYVTYFVKFKVIELLTQLKRSQVNILELRSIPGWGLSYLKPEIQRYVLSNSGLDVGKTMPDFITHTPSAQRGGKRDSPDHEDHRPLAGPHHQLDRWTNNEDQASPYKVLPWWRFIGKLDRSKVKLWLCTDLKDNKLIFPYRLRRYATGLQDNHSITIKKCCIMIMASYTRRVMIIINNHKGWHNNYYRGAKVESLVSDLVRDGSSTV